MAKQSDRDELEHWRRQLKSRLRRFSVTTEHPLADAALVGLIAEIYEMSGATLVLTRSQYARAAFTLARGALEASYDVALLAGEQARYDEYGALLRVIEAVHVENSRSRVQRGGASLGVRKAPPPAIPVRAMVEDEVRVLRKTSSAHADLLQNALEKCVNWSPSRHWSGSQRSQLIQKLGILYPGIVGISDASDGFYGLASLQAHPSPRMYRRKAGFRIPLRAIYSTHPSDRTAPIALAIAAVNLGCFAFDRRLRNWSPDIP